MAKAKRTILVEGTEISILTQKNGIDYLSLTDIAKQSSEEPRFTIQNWMRNNNTVRYLYQWEHIHNPDSNRVQMHTVLETATNNRFTMSPKKWIELVGAIGIQSKSGRYGGTYAHSDIAINFCYWLSPIFQIYLIKEFQRLKIQEAEERHDTLEWDLRRTLSKINYRVQSTF